MVAADITFGSMSKLHFTVQREALVIQLVLTELYGPMEYIHACIGAWHEICMLILLAPRFKH